MAQRQQARRIWVELEVRPYFAGARGPRRFGYSIINPRTGRAIESGPANYKTAENALRAGMSYLRMTYNTGQPQKKR